MGQQRSHRSRHRPPTWPLTFDVEVAHTANVRLCLATECAHAVRLSTIAWLGVIAIPVHIVIKRQLLALYDVPLAEDAHAKMLANVPLCYVAIGIAAVIDEARNAALFRCVEVLVALEHHEVEVRDALVVVPPHPLLEVVLVHHLPDVFVYKGLGWERLGGTEAEALLFRLDDLDGRVLLALKPLILAIFATAAVIAHAFDLGEAVDASTLIGACSREVVHACRGKVAREGQEALSACSRGWRHSFWLQLETHLAGNCTRTPGPTHGPCSSRLTW